MQEPRSQSLTLARVRETFLAVLELPEAAREGELDRRCAGDRELRDKVLRMLMQHASTTGFLESPLAILSPSEEADHGCEPIPDRIGRYVIAGLLGEGGFGRVYHAKQEAPIRRDVALKVLRRSTASRTSTARFRYEGQTLALLSHPNVARIFDADETEDGRPYFVMELIHGSPITRYADEGRLTIVQRLHLFIDVCRAVAHAHQKGVIHRDIKPSNVMVQVVEGRAEVKVIDFGIAKAIDATLSGAMVGGASLTGEAQLLGTPDYMSPEQADPELGDPDTRVDVYALGTLLYELLTGVTPLGIAARSRSSLPLTLRLIRDEEPPLPSRRVAGLGAEGVAIAAARMLEPRRHRDALVGDLDWIVMRAIEKRRDRRYDSVGALVADIERHLAHEPVLAAQRTGWYVAGKLFRRHRVGFLAAGLAVGGLAIGLVTALFALARAVEAESKSNLAREQVAAVNDFLVEDLLRAAAPEKGGLKMTIVEALDEALASVDGRFAAQPVLSARVRLVIGNVYRTLGLYERAAATMKPATALFQQHLGPDDPLTLQAEAEHAATLSDLGRHTEAEAMLRRTEERARTALGLESTVTLSVRATLGEVLQKVGQHAEAESLLMDTLDRLRVLRREDDTDFLIPATSLVASLGAQGRHAEAIPYSLMLLERAKARYGEQSPATLAAMNQYAALLSDARRFAEAEGVYRDLLAGVQEAMPAGHWQIAVTELGLGITIAKQEGKAGDAAEHLRRASAALLASLGPDHAFTERAYNDLTDTLRKLGDPSELDALRTAVGLRLRSAGAKDRESAVAAVRSFLERSKALRADVDDDRALDELDAICAGLADRGEPRAIRSLANFGWACLEVGDLQRAEQLLVRADQLARTAPQPDEEMGVEAATRLAQLRQRIAEARE